MIIGILLLGGVGFTSSDPVEPWSPANISSDQYESHPAFDPRNGDLYFVRSAPNFSGWHILVSHCGPQGWEKPVAPPFVGDGVEADPAFAAEGRSLYFISTRTTDGVRRNDLDIWRVDRTQQGQWGTPIRLPAPINSEHDEWFPRLGPDGWLYFGSDRPGGFGKTDIWRARQREGRWIVENAGPGLNTAGDEYEALPSPDGRHLILMASDGLYESDLTKRGVWSPRRKLGPNVNGVGRRVGALYSPSGRALMFSRDMGTAGSGEFFLLHHGEPEAWPAACPADQSAK